MKTQSAPEHAQPVVCHQTGPAVAADLGVADSVALLAQEEVWRQA